MKRLILIGLFLTGTAFGYPHREPIRVDSASSNIPTSADTSAGSKLAAITGKAAEVCLWNETAGRLAWNLESGTASSAPSVADGYLAAGVGFCTYDVIGAAVYIWSNTGSAISSGVVHGWVSYK